MSLLAKYDLGPQYRAVVETKIILSIRAYFLGGSKNFCHFHLGMPHLNFDWPKISDQRWRFFLIGRISFLARHEEWRILIYSYERWRISIGRIYFYTHHEEWRNLIGQIFFYQRWQIFIGRIDFSAHDEQWRFFFFRVVFLGV